MAKAADNTEPRYIPPGSCTWCGHPTHTADCTKTIRRSKTDTAAPCPCTRHRKPKGA